MCLFEHKNIKYYTDADLRSLRINERSPQCQESNDAAYVRSLRIKDKMTVFAQKNYTSVDPKYYIFRIHWQAAEWGV